MKVSFIVPVYNQPLDVFKRCLTTLTRQSHKDVEVICVFDGADEALQKMASQFKGVQVHVVDHGGAPKARNAGIKHATGDILCFWDADCYAESHMVSSWVKGFAKYPQADFLYSGYKFTDPQLPPFTPDPFDPWLISRYNFVSTMAPIRREKVLTWDESLTGLQDWDYWRRAAKLGYNGILLEGYDFTTELPKRGDISGYQSEGNVKKRIEAVRAKHKDVDSPTLFSSVIYRTEAVKIAKLFDADIFNSDYWMVRDYKNVVIVGCFPQELSFIDMVFKRYEKSNKIVYWMGHDAQKLAYEVPFQAVKFLKQKMDGYGASHICSDRETRNILDEIGITADVVHLPMDSGDACDSYPESFKVIYFGDQGNIGMIRSVVQAMPDVEFSQAEAGKALRIDDYSAALHFTTSAKMTNAAMNMLLNGRYLVSNIQAPYTGYVEVNGNPVKTKEDIIASLRAIQDKKKFNNEAQNYYMKQHDVSQFKNTMSNLLKERTLEIV